MKPLFYKGLCISVLTTLALSCASTPKAPQIKTDDEETQIIEDLKTAEPTERELYAKKIATVKISLVSSPKETTKGKIFTSPYVIQVVDQEDKPVELFEMSVVYPSAREEGKIIYTETAILTDSEGKASFLPPAPEFSFNSEISFFPKGNMEDPEIEKLAKENTIKAAYKVQTNLKYSGGVIAIVDYNQNGKANMTNSISSSNILMSLMKLGFRGIGNIDLSAQVVAGSNAKIYEKTKALVGNGSKFLIFGKIKIDSYDKSAEGITYKVKGEISCMDLTNGNITFVSEETASYTDKNDWLALDTARKELATRLAAEIKYGI